MKTFNVITILVFACFVVIVLIKLESAVPERSSTADSSAQLLRVAHLQSADQLNAFAYSFYNLKNLSIKKPEEQHRYHNFQLYPIYASAAFLNVHKNLGPYLSLQEALSQHKISITEMDSAEGADVNTLFIENTSRDTLIILGGEVIRGGKQDRMIARDFMVLPHSGKVDLNVFCVEHNRWTSQNATQAFDVSIGIAPADVRQASKHETAQEKVWEEVDELYAVYDAEPDTKTLAVVVNDEEMKGHLQPYLHKLQDITWPADVVGVVAVRDDKIVGCDIFSQHGLFTRYYKSLLNSYCSKRDQPAHHAPAKGEEVSTFFKSILQNETSLETKLSEQGTQLKNKNYRIHAAVF